MYPSPTTTQRGVQAPLWNPPHTLQLSWSAPETPGVRERQPLWRGAKAQDRHKASHKQSCITPDSMVQYFQALRKETRYHGKPQLVPVGQNPGGAGAVEAGARSGGATGCPRGGSCHRASLVFLPELRAHELLGKAEKPSPRHGPGSVQRDPRRLDPAALVQPLPGGLDLSGDGLRRPGASRLPPLRRGILPGGRVSDPQNISIERESAGAMPRRSFRHSVQDTLPSSSQVRDRLTECRPPSGSVKTARP